MRVRHRVHQLLVWMCAA